MLPSGALTVLVPVDVSVTGSPTLDAVDRLGSVSVVLLGYFPVPDQAEPALIRAEYEADAEARLQAVAGGRPGVTGVLVFTHDREATIDRVANEYDCDAVLTPREATAVERVLVPLRGDANLDRIVSVVAGLLRAGEATATFFHTVEEDGGTDRGEFVLRGAVDRLTELGVDRTRVDWRLAEGGDPRAEIVALAGEYDLVVLGETEPSLRERIIGDTLSGIVEDVGVPALVVRDAP